MSNQSNPDATAIHAALVEQLVKHGFVGYESGMKGKDVLANWLFSAAGGNGDRPRAKHYVKGSTHGDFLCGLYDNGVMLHINQHRHIVVHCAPSPTAKIVRFGNQDSRYSGSMWPELDSGNWIGYSSMPAETRATIHAALLPLLVEAEAAHAEHIRVKEAREAEERAEHHAARQQLQNNWSVKI